MAAKYEDLADCFGNTNGLDLNYSPLNFFIERWRSECSNDRESQLSWYPLNQERKPSSDVLKNKN